MRRFNTSDISSSKSLLNQSSKRLLNKKKRRDDKKIRVKSFNKNTKINQHIYQKVKLT